jgi:hypothetical protein
MRVLSQDITNRQAGQSEERADLYRSLGANDQIPGNSNTAPVVPTSGRMGEVTPPASKTAPAPTNAKGWVLHADAKGNQAYVSPDGKQFEEVK